MLSLMRRMRRNLLKDRSFGRYGLYALGEIALIVMGILAALWIDNWNDDRQLAKREQFYLAGLQSEFEQSRVKLLNLMEANRTSYRKARELADLIARSDSTPPEASLSQLLFRAYSEDMDYNPNNSLLEEMINSGRLEILADPSLRSHLTSWLSRVGRIRQQEANLREERNRTLDLARSGGASIRRILEDTGLAPGTMGLEKSREPGSNQNLLQSREFENNTLLFILTAMTTEELHYKPLLEEIELILGLIGDSLE